MPGLAGLPAVLQFGKHATGIYFFGQIGKSAPELIIGRVLGMAPTLSSSRANGLTELFHRTVLRRRSPFACPISHRRRATAGTSGPDICALVHLVSHGDRLAVFPVSRRYGLSRHTNSRMARSG